MAATTLVSVRVPVEDAKRLEALAAATDRSKSFLAAQAISSYLDAQEWQVKAIEDALKDVVAGKLVSHEKVMG